jgi:hypothetical protein
LGISQAELARQDSLNVITVKRIEAAGSEIRGSARTMVQLQRALEARGISFIDQDAKRGPGVRLREPVTETC